MSDQPSQTTPKHFLILPSIFLAVLVNWIPNLIIGLLLIEISQTFDVSIGVAGQLNSSSAIVSVIMCVFMGSLSVRYSHKSLLLVGLGFLAVTAVGSSAAPSFIILLAVFSLYGVSNATIMPMSQALIGHYFPVDQRPKMMSYLLAGMAMAFVLGSPLLGYLGDWRLAFAGVVAPLALCIGALVVIGLPSVRTPRVRGQSLLSGFRQVAKNRSAFTCIVANTMSTISYMSLNAYFAPLMRQKFAVDVEVLSIIVVFIALMYIFGSLTGGRLVNRYGRKPLTVLNAFIFGILIVVFFRLSDLWLSIVVAYVTVFCASLRYSAFSSLALEQLPEYRGTMMSLSVLSTYLAQAIGGILSGFILIASSYEGLSVVGFFAILSAFIFHFFTIDPTKTTTT